MEHLCILKIQVIFFWNLQTLAASCPNRYVTEVCYPVRKKQTDGQERALSAFCLPYGDFFDAGREQTKHVLRLYNESRADGRNA